MSIEAFEKFRVILSGAIAHKTLRRLVLSRRRRDSSHSPEKVIVRPTMIGDEALYQFAKRVGSQEVHQNRDGDATVRYVTELFPAFFADCHLFTDEADYAVRVHRDDTLTIQRSAPTHSGDGVRHNRTKRHLIPEGTPCRFLEAIGVMTPAGKVRASKYRKFRQINRFLELVDDIAKYLPKHEALRIVDFGCGRSYLTFALYHLLTEIRGRDAVIVGLDRNADVVVACRRVAEQLKWADVTFSQCDITEYTADGPVHLAVSLHACDTATDDALAKAVEWQADVILAVPCCQHEVASRLAMPTVAPILHYGILKERFAALATDALRAHLLEVVGYRTQIVEFIDMEHTAKNLLIRSVRRNAFVTDSDQLAKYERFRSSLGLSGFRLESLLGNRLSPSGESG